MDQKIVNTFLSARKGRDKHVVIEGYHALKHALRFEAEIGAVYCCENFFKNSFGETVCDEDVISYVRESATLLAEDDFARLSSHGVRTGIIALAQKRVSSIESILSAKGKIVVLENPRDLDNIGAVIRVCAAKGVTGLITTGDACPWHTHAIRASAGLHFAFPIVHESDFDLLGLVEKTKIYACTDEGESMYDIDIPSDVILVFGTERDGISQKVRDVAYKKIAIPMQENVSSMNLATSVSAILFSHK